MPLYQIIYASRSNEIAKSDIVSILEKARHSNAQKNITGTLVFSGTYFLQVLEGERSTISKTLFKIAQDPRHFEVDVIHAGPIQQRVFSAWAMAYVPTTGIDSSLYLPYMSGKTFDPFQLQAEAAIAMCKGFSEGQPCTKSTDGAVRRIRTSLS
jgi:hypothetical protein